MKPLLSVLICTMPKRAEMFNELLRNLLDQINENNLVEDVEIIANEYEELNVGAKRNLLLFHSKGKFIVFIDDDDEVSNDYLKTIVDCIKNNPKIDCIGMEGIISFDGNVQKPWSISIEHNFWHEKDGKYLRTPNHISPVLRSIALKAKFPEITFGEDKEYSDRILPMLKKEVYIADKVMYHYKYVSQK